MARSPRATGWLAGGALFVSAGPTLGARIRSDIGLALAMTTSLWLYSEALKRERLSLHLLAGLVMGWGMFAPYHASGFGVVLTLGF